MRRVAGNIEVTRDEHGVRLTLTVPGMAGWIVSRATLTGALRALADNVEGREAKPAASARSEA